jgi:hypothetical protein
MEPREYILHQILMVNRTPNMAHWITFVLHIYLQGPPLNTPLPAAEARYWAKPGWRRWRRGSNPSSLV